MTSTMPVVSVIVSLPKVSIRVWVSMLISTLADILIHLYIWIFIIFGLKRAPPKLGLPCQSCFLRQWWVQSQNRELPRFVRTFPRYNRTSPERVDRRPKCRRWHWTVHMLEKQSRTVTHYKTSVNQKARSGQVRQLISTFQHNIHNAESFPFPAWKKTA